MRSGFTVAPRSGFVYPVGSTARGQLLTVPAAPPVAGVVGWERWETNAAREASARAVGVEAWGPPLARLLAMIAASSTTPATLFGPKVGRRERARSDQTCNVAHRLRHVSASVRWRPGRGWLSAGGRSGSGAGSGRRARSRRASERS